MVRVTRYLNEKFPPAQAAAIVLGSLVVYLACGRLTTGTPGLDPGAAAAAVTTTLFFLQARLLDDYDTHYTDLCEIAHLTPRGLLIGTAVTTIPIIALNTDPTVIGYALLPTVVMVGGSVVIALWCPLRTDRPLTRRRAHVVALVLGRIPLFDVGPLFALVYVGVKWEQTRGVDASPGSIWLLAAVTWIQYEIWKVSRNIGRYEGYDYIYRPYGISWAQQRVMTAVLCSCGLAFNVILFVQADLSVGFLVFAMVMSIVPVVLALRGLRDHDRPWWRGLVFPALMVAGLLVQFLALA